MKQIFGSLRVPFKGSLLYVAIRSTRASSVPALQNESDCDDLDVIGFENGLC